MCLEEVWNRCDVFFSCIMGLGKYDMYKIDECIRIVNLFGWNWNL